MDSTAENVLIAAGSVAGLYLVYRLTSKTDAQESAQKKQAIAADVARRKTYDRKVNLVSNKTGKVLKSYMVNLESVADEVFTAFHGSLLTDQTRAIKALKTLPVNLVNEVDYLYRVKYSNNDWVSKYEHIDSLNQDFLKYLSASEYASVANYFNS